MTALLSLLPHCSVADLHVRSLSDDQSLQSGENLEAVVVHSDAIFSFNFFSDFSLISDLNADQVEDFFRSYRPTLSQQLTKKRRRKRTSSGGLSLRISLLTPSNSLGPFNRGLTQQISARVLFIKEFRLNLSHPTATVYFR